MVVLLLFASWLQSRCRADGQGKVKLATRAAQFAALEETQERTNAVCNWISPQAWGQRLLAQCCLHKLTYSAVRERFALSAQLTIRAISRVADADSNAALVMRTRALVNAPYAANSAA